MPHLARSTAHSSTRHPAWEDENLTNTVAIWLAYARGALTATGIFAIGTLAYHFLG
jgi:hypothetical protein